MYIDAMSIVQKQMCNQKTFSEVAKLLFSSFLMESGQCRRINILFDVYQDKSIKNIERFGKRGAVVQQLLSNAFLEATSLNSGGRL